MNVQNVNHFERLWSLGYRRLCPIIPPNAPVNEHSALYRRIAKRDPRGKMPGIRKDDGTWRGFDFVSCESTPADLARWNAMGAGVGIKTGQGLALIDADTLNSAWAKLIEREIVERFGALPVRFGNAPKVGYLVRVDGDFQYARVEFGERDDKGRAADRVEILYEGRQFVAHGVHPGTMRPYHWPDGVPRLDDVPVVRAEALTAFLDALGAQLPGTARVVQEGGSGPAVAPELLVGDIDQVRAAIASLPNTTELFPVRESYVAVAYAVRGAFGPDREDEARDAFLGWCARWEDPDGEENDPDEAAADWARARNPRIGAEWLYKRAAQHGGEAYAQAVAEKWFDPASCEPLFPPDLPKSFDAASSPKVLTFTPFAEAAETAMSVAARPLVKGLLDQGAMTVLYGASNTGKTFVAMDLAFHIAAGAPWGGMKVTPGFHVVYVAAEGGMGARKRAAALHRKYGDAAHGKFHFLLSPVDLLHPNADLRPLIAAIAALEVPVGLVVIDTLARALAGGDENASTDMGALVNHLDVLRKASGAHLLAVHHSGKDALKGARGWSGLRAATDTEIEIAEGQITVMKQRDLDREWTAAFFLDVVELGRDAEGDPVTSCTIRLEVAAPGKRASVGAVGKPTQKEAKILEAVREIQTGREDGVEGVTVTDVLSYLGGDVDKVAWKATSFHIQALNKKRLLRRIVRGRYAVTDECQENGHWHWSEGQSVGSECQQFQGEFQQALFE